MLRYLGTIAAPALALLLAAGPAGAGKIVGPGLNGPRTPVVAVPPVLDGRGRLPDCTPGGLCQPGGWGSSGRSGVRDYYRNLHPDMRGQRRWRPARDYKLPPRNYRQPDPYVDLNIDQPSYSAPSTPRRIDGNPAISGPHVVWCQERYRSYRKSDNTYQPYQGARRPCRSPYG